MHSKKTFKNKKLTNFTISRLQACILLKYFMRIIVHLPERKRP